MFKSSLTVRTSKISKILCVFVLVIQPVFGASIFNGSTVSAASAHRETIDLTPEKSSTDVKEFLVTNDATVTFLAEAERYKNLLLSFETGNKATKDRLLFAWADGDNEKSQEIKLTNSLDDDQKIEASLPSAASLKNLKVIFKQTPTEQKDTITITDLRLTGEKKDTEKPTVAIKESSIGTTSKKILRLAEFKLSDNNEIVAYYINGNKIMVSPGELSDVNGIEVNTRNGVYGKNIIIAEDSDGNRSDPFEFYLDNVPPEVTIKDGFKGDKIKNEFSQLGFRLQDEHDISTIALNKHFITASDEQTVDLEFSNFKQYLRKGTNRLVVTDDAGNETKVTFIFKPEKPQDNPTKPTIPPKPDKESPLTPSKNEESVIDQQVPVEESAKFVPIDTDTIPSDPSPIKQFSITSPTRIALGNSGQSESQTDAQPQTEKQRDQQNTKDEKSVQNDEDRHDEKKSEVLAVKDTANKECLKFLGICWYWWTPVAVGIFGSILFARLTRREKMQYLPPRRMNQN